MGLNVSGMSFKNLKLIGSFKGYVCVMKNTRIVKVNKSKFVSFVWKEVNFNAGLIANENRLASFTEKAVLSLLCSKKYN